VENSEEDMYVDQLKPPSHPFPGPWPNNGFSILRICKYCNSNEVENEIHFLLSCNRYDRIRKSLVEDIISKYPDFNFLNDHNKTVFLFNSIDAAICGNKVTSFTDERFSLRNESIDIGIVN